MSRRLSVVARYSFCPGYLMVRYIALAVVSDAGNFTRAAHFPRFGLTRTFAATGFPVLLRDTCASIRALAARAIVPDTVSVDPDRRARVILMREDGAGPSVSTGARKVRPRIGKNSHGCEPIGPTGRMSRSP